MRVRSAIQRWDERFGTDDARLWAEVLGAVLAFGFFVRAAVHVYAALTADAVLDEHVDPHLAGRDVSLRSPIVGLQGHWLAPSVRVVTAVAGAGVGMLLHPLPGAPPIVEAWVAMNIAVPVLDPAGYLVLIARGEMT